MSLLPTTSCLCVFNLFLQVLFSCPALPSFFWGGQLQELYKNVMLIVRIRTRLFLSMRATVYAIDDCTAMPPLLHALITTYAKALQA